MKSALAAEIIKAMREQGLTWTAAAERADVQRADISRICKVDLDRFTIDRLVRILNRLDRRVEVVVSAPLHPAPKGPKRVARTGS